MPISTNDLNPNTNFLISGTVGFSRISKRIEGEELQKDIQRQKALGRRVIHDKPYTSLSINNAQVLIATPGKPTIEESYAQEHLYKSSAKGATGYSFTGRNKSATLPAVYVHDPNNPNKVVPMNEPLTGELAVGLRVTLIMRTFKSPQNNGVSLDGVILDEPIRYYSSNTLDLSAYGITVEGAPQAPIQDAAEPETPVPTTPPPAPMNYPNYTVNSVPTQQAGAIPAYPNYGTEMPSAPANTAPGTPGINYNLNDRQY